MRDMRHSLLSWSRLPAARALVLLLGTLGFVVGPVGAGTHGGTSATAAISGVRTVPAERVPAQKAPARNRVSAKVRTARHAQAAVDAVVRHAAGAAAPSAQPVHAVLPASGTGVPRPPGLPAVPAAAPAAPDLAPRAVPRGRAPPSAGRI
ncbi:hypothetical protein [Actinomadura monticuli]|uniref:Uncharacterized protein n=1 Tax=Actinomadura monticuli TaxID=3097367 RepID=A0ABV4Q893_9ACTN